MTAIVMDGKAVAAKVRAEVAVRAKEFAAKYGRRPGLAVVQVGQDPASTVYVRNKRKSSLEAEIESFAHDLPATTSQARAVGSRACAESRSARRRHPRADAAAQGARQRPDHGRRGSGQGCGWLSSDQHRPVGAEAPEAAAVHAVRCDPAGEGVRHQPDRAARHGRGGIQHCRTAHGARVAAGPFDGHCLSHRNQGPASPRLLGRMSWWLLWAKQGLFRASGSSRARLCSMWASTARRRASWLATLNMTRRRSGPVGSRPCREAWVL